MDYGIISSKPLLFKSNQSIDYLSQWIESPDKDNKAGATFGSRVVISKNSNVVVVSDHTYNNSVGRVYIYNQRFDGYKLTAILDSPIIEPGAYFGNNIAISANNSIIAVTAPGEGNQRGAIYIYRLLSNKWTLCDRIVATFQDLDYFGNFMVLSGDGTVLAASTMNVLRPEDDANSGIGTISIFKYVSGDWVEELHVRNRNKYYGFSLSIDYSGSLLAVGNPTTFYDGGGSVDLYKRKTMTDSFSQWSLDQTIYAKPECNNAYGANVVLSSDGSKLAIGALSTVNKPSSVEIYKVGEDDFIIDLEAYGPSLNLFGQSMAMTAAGTKVFTAAPLSKQKTMYAIDISKNPVELTKMVNITNANVDRLGNSISVSADGSVICIGTAVNDKAYRAGVVIVSIASG